MRAAHVEKPPAACGRILAVTGSKGGVGKSNLVVNLAVALARSGRRVLVVDGDLGLANLDVLLGLVAHRTVEHLITEGADLDDLLVEGPAGIRVLPAASGVPALARLDDAPRRRVLEALRQAAALADDVLVDTGAGLGETTLALQLAAARVVVVTTPEPTSLVDAYATLKVLWAEDGAKPVDLVVNNVERDADAVRVFEQLSRACRHFLHREPGWMGPVYHDPKLPEAVRRQRALADLYPTSRAARCYERIALQLMTQTAGGSDAAHPSAPMPDAGPSEVIH